MGSPQITGPLDNHIAYRGYRLQIAAIDYAPKSEPDSIPSSNPSRIDDREHSIPPPGATCLNRWGIAPKKESLGPLG